jgi:large subunit ribosomal protein L9
MDVILLERVEKLGQMGDVVTVKPGYARNFLLPKNKALRATEANKKVFEERRAQLEADNLARKADAEAVAAKMTDVDVTLIRQAGEAGQLYGSVSARDVATALTDAGYTVSRTQVDLAKPIKTIGLFDVSVKLHPEVAISVTANVARSADEAETQLETGRAVIGAAEEEAAEDEAALEAEAVFEEGVEVDEETLETIEDPSAAVEDASADADAEDDAETKPDA